MPIYRLSGLPDFNVSSEFVVHSLEGFRSRAKPRAEFAASGAPGAVPVGPWDPAEKYLLLKGQMGPLERSAMPEYNDLLHDALPTDTDAPVVVLDPHTGRGLQVWVRNYDEPTVTWAGPYIKFSFPLVALDPYKYALESLSGQFGVFTGDDWFTTMTIDTAPTPDEFYVEMGPAYGVQFEQAQAASEFPPALVVTSDGDATSQRLVLEVTGPLQRGDWQLLHENTGDQLWVDLSLSSAQTVRFDCQNQTATLNGSPVDTLVFGDWLTLQSGSNTFRLTSGTASGGFATLVEAYPAHR